MLNKRVLIGGVLILGAIVWAGISNRWFFTPTVSLKDLSQQSNCDKQSKVAGSVVKVTDTPGYILEQEGTRVEIAVPNHVHPPHLPAVGEDIRATVYVGCSNGVADLVLETSREPSR